MIQRGRRFDFADRSRFLIFLFLRFRQYWLSVGPTSNHVAFSYDRTIHFPDTDAAGVVFFANYLSICHEAYEEALAAAGIPLRAFFSDQGVVIPVSKSSVDYLRPLRCGDKIRVTVAP